MAESARGCLGFLFELFGARGRRDGADRTMPTIQVSNRFITDAEADFFRVLTRVVGAKAYVLAQVSLKQLLWLPGNSKTNPGRGTWQNKIAGRSVDFLICDPSTLHPIVAIELDEPTHAQPGRQTRDAEVEAALHAAGLPLLRVLTSRSYNTRELSAALAPHLMHPGN